MSLVHLNQTLTSTSAQQQFRRSAFKQQPPRCLVGPSNACKCQQAAEPQLITRRQALQLTSAAAVLFTLPQGALAAAKGPPGFNAAKDTQDSYQFIYPFGWQEVSVDGQDVVYKDIIEPLESASVSITKTDKSSVTEFGNPLEVAQQLTNEVLTPRSQQAKVLGVNKREIDGRTYYEFEFATKANTYIRHALAVVTVANSKFYTLVTGSNDSRWSKMKERLVEVVKSFQVSDRFAAG